MTPLSQKAFLPQFGDSLRESVYRSRRVSIGSVLLHLPIQNRGGAFDGLSIIRLNLLVGNVLDEFRDVLPTRF